MGLPAWFHASINSHSSCASNPSLQEDWEKLKVADLVSICRAWPKHGQYGARSENVDINKKTPLRSARATATALRKLAQQRQRLRATAIQALKRFEKNKLDDTLEF